MYTILIRNANEPTCLRSLFSRIGIATIMRIVKYRNANWSLCMIVPMDGRLSIHHLGDDGNSRLDTAMNRVVRNSVLARCRRENFDIWGL